MTGQTGIVELCQEHGTDAVMGSMLDIAERREQLEAQGIPDQLIMLCQSDAEMHFLAAAYAVCPEIVGQFRVDGYRADFAIPERGLLIEIDGRHWHTDAKAFAHDRKRDRRLGGSGWRILRFAASEVYQDAGACVADVVTAREPLPFDEPTGVEV